MSGLQVGAPEGSPGTRSPARSVSTDNQKKRKGGKLTKPPGPCSRSDPNDGRALPFNERPIDYDKIEHAIQKQSSRKATNFSDYFEETIEKWKNHKDWKKLNEEYGKAEQRRRSEHGENRSKPKNEPADGSS